MIDPRNPPIEEMIHCGNAMHPSLYKTLTLLKIESVVGPVWFVVEGLASYPKSAEYNSLTESQRYFYDEHSCPTNYIPIEAISHDGDMDPHGVFDLVDVVWMTTEYDPDDNDVWLTAAFPQLSESRPMAAVPCR